MVLAQSDRLTAGRRPGNKRTGTVAGKGQQGFDLRIVGKALGVRQIEGAPIPVHGEGSLLGALNPGRRPVGVPEEEIRRVYQHPTAGFGRDRKPPVNRRRKASRTARTSSGLSLTAR